MKKLLLRRKYLTVTQNSCLEKYKYLISENRLHFREGNCRRREKKDSQHLDCLLLAVVNRK